MGSVAVIGERTRIEGFALAGARLLPAETPDAARAAWTTLPPDVEVVILTPGAAAAVGPPVDDAGPLTVVMPR